MLNYADYSICLVEIPDEISLGISFSGCPRHCTGCHSPHLWDIADEKTWELTESKLLRFVDQYQYITCVLFLGGDWDQDSLYKYVTLLKDKRPNLKVALYSGSDSLESVSESILTQLDYIKIGSYKATLGGLTSPITNQRLYKREGTRLVDITNKFRGDVHAIRAV